MEHTRTTDIVNASIVNDVVRRTRALRYGLVSLKVHDGKIVQIEVTEKTRCDDRWIGGEGGGI